ncbi:uncharacterized protein LOC119026611 [Acanthopagrus latus]|uniref:uncharacterized protein LOC119026611 n=1 Tax=Acanthopagrus latus TaxID=8177 RepID=UPI00187C5F9C|nr:uncharacterized protein LOC119026611 [Acanthopagrus latus]XP_036966913.1 uncharacterized protein LOC119026611 [Acanthopagrus latus]XP_036966914.1 uncharacterized protein LOC119026611 [Acanthopagrus latus]XP_036966916.1 uncharacterized protein LOC119026611 [Acanthopagrus latus]
MTPSVFAVCLIWLLGGQMAQATGPKSSSIHQDSDFVSVRAGDDVTLPCFYKGEIAAKLYWYKQPLGQKPQLISTYYLYEEKATFYNDFKNNPRFTLDTENGKNYLTIADLHISDSATYYCMRCYLNMLEISETITVGVTGSASIHQSPSESIQPGGSVTLNCTVQTGTCDGEHSVYWFKHSQESQPGLIYIDGGRNDQCERKGNTQTHTCVYNLPMKSLNRSHAGTYYCAVATCGHVLFGDGTKLYTNDEDAFGYFWRGASAFFSILAVLLAFSVCMMNRGNGCKTSGSRLGCSAPSKASAEGYQNANNLYYAALRVNLTKRSRRQRDQTWSECVYLRVKQ